MESDGAWLSGLFLALLGLTFVLRIQCPNVSRRAETAALFSVTVLFFLIGSLFLGPAKPLTQALQRARSPQVVRQP